MPALSFQQASESYHVTEGIANPTGGGYIPPMNERIAKIETRLDGIERDLGTVRTDLQSMHSEFLSIKKWMLSSFLATVAVIIALLSWQASWFQQSLERNWEISRKAEERATDSNIKAEAIRLATEWQKQPTSAPVIQKNPKNKRSR